MQILAVDVGTGTQDVLLFDTDKEPENALKMVMPSPTRLLAQAIRDATRAGDDLLLTGVTMGGGPCGWAAEEHLKAGYRLFATPDAARTFNDDLERVEAMGVEVVSQDEAAGLSGVRRLTMLDFDYDALARAFATFGVDLDRVDLLAVAVFDHGAAPPGYSDRLFRFEYLAERIQTGAGLAAFAFERSQIPPSMTRLQAAASTAPADRPLVAMDTAPAAVLGALEDPGTRARPGGDRRQRGQLSHPGLPFAGRGDCRAIRAPHRQAQPGENGGAARPACERHRLPRRAVCGARAWRAGARSGPWQPRFRGCDRSPAGLAGRVKAESLPGCALWRYDDGRVLGAGAGLRPGPALERERD